MLNKQIKALVKIDDRIRRESATLANSLIFMYETGSDFPGEIISVAKKLQALNAGRSKLYFRILDKVEAYLEELSETISLGK